MIIRKISIILFSLIHLFVIDATFLIAQTSDTTPPEIISFDFNPKIADVTLGRVDVLFSIVATDTSGIVSGFVYLKHESGLLLVSGLGPDLRGVITFSQMSLPGLYTVEKIGVQDRFGNTTTLYTDILKDRDFPAELSVILNNTPPGQNVIVGPISGVTITYKEVIYGGQTAVVSSSSGSTPPSGFKLGTPPTYYSISTTAQFNPPVTICVSYDEIQFKNEKNLKLFHFENGWVNVTNLLDITSNIICGQVSSFSEFGLFEDITTEHIVDEVKSFNLEPGIQQSLLDKLTAAQSAIERNQNKTAGNILKAFLNLVNAQKGKKITNEQAQILLTDTKALINSLGGFSLNSFFKFLLFGWLDKIINAMLGGKV